MFDLTTAIGLARASSGSPPVSTSHMNRTTEKTPAAAGVFDSCNLDWVVMRPSVDVDGQGRAGLVDGKHVTRIVMAAAKRGTD